MKPNCRPLWGPFPGFFLVLLLLGACTTKPVVWQKPGVDAEEQGADLAQCRSYAAREAEREFVRDQNDAGASGADGQSMYARNMETYQVQKSTGDLLIRCMKLKGYRQAP